MISVPFAPNRKQRVLTNTDGNPEIFNQRQDLTLQTSRSQRIEN